MKLRDWLSTTNTTHAAFAETIGVARETVTRWVGGEVVPDWPLVLRIEDQTKGAVTAMDWAAAARERA